jgi:hypothetical protein
VLLVVAALAGCGEEDPPLDFACTSGAEAVERALAAAPGDVRLTGGVPLSTCVRNARSDAELQNVGAVLTGAAEHLEEAAPRDAEAALQLGFLIGAARRGGDSANGVQAELIRRLERSGALDGATPAAKAALARGLAAGEERG